MTRSNISKSSKKSKSRNTRRITRYPKIRSIPWTRRKRSIRKKRAHKDTDLEIFFRRNDQYGNPVPVVWENIDGTLHPYANWSDEEKQQLQNMFDFILEGGEPNLPETPPTIGNVYSIYRGLEYSLAWDYFIAFVAQSLAVEMGNWVPWSIFSYDDRNRRILFDSRSLFTAITNDNGFEAYNVIPSQYFGGGVITPGDPVRIYEFLEFNNFIGNSRLETLENLFVWCTDHMVHYGHYWNDPPGSHINYLHWQYDYYPPVERIINGTIRVNQTVKKHWTQGCHGTTAFLKMVLRTINMPVQEFLQCGHSQSSFLIERQDTTFTTLERTYLTHGDDLYTTTIKPSSLIPRRELLIDQQTFDSWYGSSVSPDDACNNVSRQPRELSIEYLTPWLLHTHCEDLEQGNDHENSTVFRYLGRIYSLETLESANLWERIENKIAEFGGCENIPSY